jgi:apolipoprotein N-acyltransferase
MGISHVIWPETALPFFLTEEPQALAALDTLLPPGATLITGAPRMERTSEGRRFYNSVYVIDDGGRILSAYDKVHLVPFGEYLPFESVLRAVGLSELTKQIGGFSSGPGLQTISIPGGLRAGFLVCYEVIFPSKVVDPQDRPDFIVNLTNDGWFGLTSGPYQHLDQARMRAIEEGLPVVRATNTGISAVIDAYGRITGSIPLGQAGVLDAVVPAMRPIVLFPLINAYFLLTWSVISVMVATTAWGKLKRPR